MGTPLAITALVLLLALAAWWLFNGGLLATSAAETVDDSSGTASPPAELRYRVPEGQDPAAVVAALVGRGYADAAVAADDPRTVVVPCPGGTAHHRGDVRAAIESAGTAIDDPVPAAYGVRFEDERRR